MKTSHLNKYALSISKPVKIKKEGLQNEKSVQGKSTKTKKSVE